MTFDQITAYVGSVPHMPPDRGKIVYDFIRSARPERILELGFAHGTSACYMAAALEENGAGRILTIDHLRARNREPNLLQLLERTGLASRVEPVFCERSYTWELLKLLEANTRDGVTTPVFDFVFIDGGHTWDSDGFSFLLADRLLKPGGWMLFDDVLWTPATMAGEAWVEEMPEEERNVAHVEKVFHLLVIPHGGYGDFQFDGTWAWARKTAGAGTAGLDADVLKQVYRSSATARRMMQIRRYVKRLLGKS